MKWEDGRRSDNIEDRRGQSSRRTSGLPIGRGRGGIMGLLVIVGIAWLLGINPLALLGGGGISGGVSPGPPPGPVQASPEEEALKEFVSVVLADTEDTWNTLFAAAGGDYREPVLVLYRGGTQTACGFGQAAAGPFYCPGDQKVYLDLSFFSELSQRFGAPGDFAAAYVVAHEVGHHVQTLMGVAQQVQQTKARVSQAEANRLQVRMELQADCFSGIWAHHAQRSRQILEQGDIEEALRAASAVGDDTIMKRTQGYVVPEGFTHGSAEQRQRWFMQGFQSGEPGQCDTFNASRL